MDQRQIYIVEVDGRQYDIEGDRPPTEAEARALIDAVRTTGPSPDLPGAHIGPPVALIDRLLNALPMLGGATGGIVGGAGGTAFGMGFGGVPGAVGGAAMGGATGEAMRQTGRRILGRDREVPETPLGAAAEMGTAGAVQGGLELAGAGAMRGLGTVGEAAYRGYLKPSLAARNLPKVREVVQTAIDEALPVTPSGAGQANAVIRDLRRQVEDMLQNTPGDVDLHQVAERVRAFAKAKYYRPGTPSADFDAAMRVADSIDRHPSLGLPPGARPSRVTVTATQANQVKRGLDTAITDAQFGIESGAAKSTQKFARRDLRQELERLAPEIGPLNARESRLIDAAKAIDRAVAREGNQSLTHGVKTIGAAMAGGAEYERTGDPYQAAAEALALRIALTPAVATRAAIVASRLGKMTGAVPANIARAAILAVSETEGQSEDVPDNPTK